MTEREPSDLHQAIIELADASYESGRCDARERHQIGAAMIYYDRSDKLRALVVRAERIEAAAHALDESLFDSINNSRIPARVRNAHIDLGKALATAAEDAK